MNHRFANLLAEAVYAHQAGHDSKAMVLLDEARAVLLQPPTPVPKPGVRPEDDPTRSAADRELWRQARGA